ncbi:GTP-binding protein REM 1-like [Limulus polyphemus]|uniref:GTP-binding protein REM 1-like n=1 Tax=Limulus polyphemus TaxID=6850 RepID=A0ABM1TPW4_LIMPO|nr:GTP-binding protein REM 1-like [Limulus polyphemus]
MYVLGGLNETVNQSFCKLAKEEELLTESKIDTKSGTIRRTQSVKATRRFQTQCRRERISSIPGETYISSGETLPSGGSSKDIILTSTKFERLRNFSVTSKGIVNRGDSFRSKSRSSGNFFCSRNAPNSKPSTANIPIVLPSLHPVPVLIVGSSNVGKSSLSHQFTTSEYICTYDCSLDDENEKTVRVVLNEEETDLLLIEKSITTETISALLNLDVASYVVMYSVVDKISFQRARNFISQMTRCVDTTKKTVILVGNKTDLVRLRKISLEEGRSLAKSHGCKFIEISTGLNHHLDELLVGIINQFRLKRHCFEVTTNDNVVPENSRRRFIGCIGSSRKYILKRILRRSWKRCSSCDNLNGI